MTLIACIASATQTANQTSITTIQKANQFERPKSIQETVDAAFTKNASMQGHWHFDGDSRYSLCNINEEELIKHLSSNKKDIYIIDAGCGDGSWGRSKHDFIKQHYKGDNNKQFHIFSLTGSQECPTKTQRDNNIVLHQINEFKIENIDEELEKHGFFLKENVDLIVSRWTLRHLVDPFGTLTKMYSLLKPSSGMMLANGFLFKEEDSNKAQSFPLLHQPLVSASNASALFYANTRCYDLHEFCLLRNDEKPLGLPIEYTGKYKSIQDKHSTSNIVTEFNLPKDVNYSHYTTRMRFVEDHKDIYYVPGDDKGIKLYALLKDNDLIEK